MTLSKIDIVFTGLIREYDTFKKSLCDLDKLRKKGLVHNIILSTWIGETAKHPDILEFMDSLNIKIIESKEPEVNLNSPYYKNKDFIWHQMKALDVGLANIESKKFVLKTRSDVYIQPDFIEKLAKEKENLLKIEKNLPNGNIFKYKVWVPWFELTKPFFMADECFFGLKEDLEKLYNYNKDYFEKYDLGPDVHHVMRYINPFLEKYPIFYSSLEKFRKDRSLKNYVKRNYPVMFEKLKKYNFLKKASEKSRFNILNSRLNNQEYVNLLAAYYSVLYSHFYINLTSFKDQIIFRDFYKGELPISDSKIAEKNFGKEKVRFQNSGMIYFYEMNFIRSAVNKNLENTELANKIYIGLDNFNSSSK